MPKSKFQKKKDREKEVHKKIILRREAKRAKERENAKFDAEERAVRPKQKPILNKELYAARSLRKADIKMKLEQNLELLENLQKEYENRAKFLNSEDLEMPFDEYVNEDGTSKIPAMIEETKKYLKELNEK